MSFFPDKPTQFRNYFEFTGTVCPIDQSNYAEVDGHCYYLEMVRMTYEEAKVNCASKFSSGKLFEPLSLQVNDLVWEEFKDTIVPGYGPWIGVTDQETNSVFKYTSSGSVVSFTIPWFAGITLKPSEECVYMWTEARWNEHGCTADQTSICEQ